ncbi:Fe-S protein assembly co-chaperone HscB [Paraphotobacterium marinum]|uniref:Co-chaperone protein HscB homolog n=1 Tax=Paraphotobacterium marinum TaxID=1755811 RepID=A0A220VDL4_9GAMM|nr:Fe-S protein assembly co-chaperone HscB [Paraphotobacterium marinum]ASK78439.1 Fe-S protein assembly co-chaperone HscB [Paraphotobacterium marinum]
MNYFKLFDIEQSFDVDLSTLQKKYFNLQNTFHPDKYSTASSRDKLLVLQKTSEINDAYNVLKNPISRAEHLLNINGIHFDSNKTIADDTFLFEQMELRETIEEVSNDIENMQNKLEELSQYVDAKYNKILEQLNELIGIENWNQVFLEVQKLKFYSKLVTEIEDLEDKII